MQEKRDQQPDKEREQIKNNNLPGQVTTRAAMAENEGGSSKTQPRIQEVEGANGVVWNLVKMLGSGSFGEVYLGLQDSKPGEPKQVSVIVAVKLKS